MLLILIRLSAPLAAQGGLLQYHMQQLPQSALLNPAQMPYLNGYLSLPGLSGARVEAGSSGFNYLELEYNDEFDVYKSRFGEIAERLREEGNQIFIGADVPLMGFGFKLFKGFLSFDAREQTRLDVIYPQSLFQMFHDVQQQKWGQEQEYLYDLSNLNATFTQYLNLSLGYAMPITPRLSAGLRAHIYAGQFSGHTENQGLVFRYSGDGSYFQIMGNTELRSGGLGLFSANEEEKAFNIDSASVFSLNNRGFGLDFGVLYRLTDQIEFSAGVNQIGSIRWNDDVRFNSLNQGSMISTQDIKDLFGDFGTVAEPLIDGTPTGGPRAFTTRLPTNLYFGGRFYPVPSFSLGLVVNPVLIRDMIDIGASVSTNVLVGKTFGVSAAYTYNRHNPLNLGIGLSVALGPLQLYAVTDNLLVLSGYRQARYFNAQAGVNFLFGKQTRAGLLKVAAAEEKERIARKKAMEEESETEIFLVEGGGGGGKQSAAPSKTKIRRAKGGKPAKGEIAMEESRPAKSRVSKEKRKKSSGKEGGQKLAAAKTKKAKPEEAQPELARAEVDSFEEEAVELEEGYVNFIFRTKDRISGERVKGINMDIYKLVNGRRELVFTGSAFSGLYSIPLERKYPHLLIVRKQGYQPEEFSLEEEFAGESEREARREILMSRTAPRTESAASRQPRSVPEPARSPEQKAISVFEQASVPERMAVPDPNPSEPVSGKAGVQDENMQELPFSRKEGETDTIGGEDMEDWFFFMEDEEEPEKLEAIPSAAAAAPAGNSSSETAPEARFYHLTGETSLRKGPLHTHPVVLRFQTGSRVELLEKTDTFWWKVRFGNYVGYVKKLMLKAAE